MSEQVKSWTATLMEDLATLSGPTVFGLSAFPGKLQQDRPHY